MDVTTDVARRAKNNLEARNYRVEILAEFDARLNAATREYSPRAFLAIHADSCIFSASGFKVARAEISAIPQEEDRMVRCLIAAYADATLLRYHADSITRDMTHYHALGEINLQSPAAIIELGFLGSDAETLKKRDLLAQGVADGLDSFLKGNECK
ncbi:MAG: N-acetylmuramoyl-L-alanine amidase [Chloroflexi bacterium]|nr:N-acetylmuramoyl-L-alanine amidase [Chloroflexota bacterium]